MTQTPKPTVSEVEAAIVGTGNGGGTTYPPVKMNDRKRKLIQNYIDMGMSADDIAKAIIGVQKGWWKLVGEKLWKRGAK